MVTGKTDVLKAWGWGQEGLILVPGLPLALFDLSCVSQLL